MTDAEILLAAMRVYDLAFAAGWLDADSEWEGLTEDSQSKFVALVDAAITPVVCPDMASPISEPFPFHNHRTLAEVWAEEGERHGG